MPRWNVNADHGETRERLRHKKTKPQGRRSVHDLHESATPGDTPFTDASLNALHGMGLLEELIGELKSGKEATVYLARSPTRLTRTGLSAVKLYRDLGVRSFKNDAVYRQGRYIGDDRIEKAIRQRSHTGLAAQETLWVMQEYAELWTLYQAGVPTPRPLVGPDPYEYGKAGKAVLMEFIGDEHGPAPRLSEARLTPREAQEAWSQSLDILAQFLQLGRAHGDYSTYNLLWWEDHVIVIDFPQVVKRDENPHFDTLLQRDITSICQSFRRHGITADPQATRRDVQRRARTQPLKQNLQLP